MTERSAIVERQTAETKIRLELQIDGNGRATVNSGIGFLDHMIATLVRHSSFNLELSCEGDLAVDDHHTTEDIAIVLGSALDQALGERRGIARFGYAYAPLDESLARAVVDLSGRPYAVASIDFGREKVGDLATENIEHFFQSLAISLRGAIHVDILRGQNAHHMAEAAFKALALALKQAVKTSGGRDIPSTKEVL